METYQKHEPEKSLIMYSQMTQYSLNVIDNEAFFSQQFPYSCGSILIFVIFFPKQKARNVREFFLNIKQKTRETVHMYTPKQNKREKQNKKKKRERN